MKLRCECGRPVRPEWLDAEAAAKWDELLPELERRGLLTIIDGDALAGYCVAWSELRDATLTLAKEGRYLKALSGYLSPHPALAQQRRSLLALKAFSALYGLNPADRGRLKIEKPPEVDAKMKKFAAFGKGR